MNEGHGTTRGLVWKESRQLMPVLLILSGVGLLLVVLWQWIATFSYQRDYIGNYLPFVLPALFSVGAAAVLVGQEKEQKTLWWLGSLPTPPARVFWIKLAASMVGLVIMWGVCAVLVALTHAGHTGGYAGGMGFGRWLGASTYVFLAVHSFYILVCGFYTTWRFKGTFASLLGILPLSIVPFVVIEAIGSLRNWGLGPSWGASVESVLVTYSVLVASIVLMTWLANRAAMKALGPTEPESPRKIDALSWAEPWRPSELDSSSRDPYRLSIASLLWQSIHHSRYTLLAITAMIMLGTVAGSFFTRSQWVSFAGGQLGALMLAGLVGVAWLGVFAFTGDGSASRLRFLADRGASPTIVWAGRHLVGLSIVATAILLYWLLTYQVLPNLYREGLEFIPSVAFVTLVLWVFYSVSQWTSQLTRLLALSTVLAPVLSIFTAYWLGYAAMMLYMPLWLLVLLSMLPMLATWLMMRRYMDENRGWQSWVISIGAIGLIMCVPLISPALKVAQFPTISDAIRSQRLAQAKATKRFAYPQPLTIHQTLGYENLIDEKPSAEKRLAQLEKRNFEPRVLFQPPGGSIENVPALSIDSQTLFPMIKYANYQKVRVQSAPDNEVEAAAMTDWIEMMVDVVKRLRKSSRWLDQDRADVIEIWLTNLMSDESFDAFRERDFAKETIAMLANQEARSEARRRAVLISWYDEVTKRESRFDSLGGYESNSWPDEYTMPLRPDEYTMPLRPIIQPRLAEAVADAGLRMIEASEQGKPIEPIRRELHNLLIGPEQSFDVSPYGPLVQASSDRVHPSDLLWAYRNLPSIKWYSPWEQKAKALANQDVDSAETKEME
ncbi:ABC-2 family transporter protein [Planctomycetes bacterium CA13]|uniref:ABC-2 family transporter protein n=1 Tax=Novipirellula herctigrandis TaxID=2527986 RepID=A0A5C5Z2I4_9BACT|nr:ABC-2 family transporter protein [Planctomycetes bacterium CA13]